MPTAITAGKVGKATILFPGGGEVFYPIQNFNRDLSVFEIKTFGEGFLREREDGRKSTKQQYGKDGEGAKHRKERGAKQQNAIGEEREVKEKDKEKSDKEQVKEDEGPNSMDVDSPPR